MLVDAHYWRGDGHLVCQDYAHASAGAVVVCDGCSSSPHTDVGARLLAHSALANPQQVEEGDVRWLDAPRHAVRSLGVPLEALDATCILARCDDEAIYVTMLGDGVVAARALEGQVEVHEVSFEHGTPSYPSYALVPERAAAYRTAGLDACSVQSSAEALTVATPVRGGHRWVFDRARYGSVMIASDGVSAVCPRGDRPRPASTLIEQLFRFPSPHGSFVARRLRRFMLREAPQAGLRPHDDIALAAICSTPPTGVLPEPETEPYG